MSLPSVPAAKFLFAGTTTRNGDVESLPAAPVDPLTAVRPRPTGMLKPQLTLLLQLNRCRGCPVCYKNDNRVTPTRQRKSTQVQPESVPYCYATVIFVQVDGGQCHLLTADNWWLKAAG